MWLAAERIPRGFVRPPGRSDEVGEDSAALGHRSVRVNWYALCEVPLQESES